MTQLHTRQSKDDSWQIMTASIERAVIGAMLLLDDQPLPPEVLQIEPSYFRDRKHADIWMAMEDLLANRKPHDPVSVSGWLKEHNEATQAAYLCQLEADCPTTVNLGHWAKLLVEDGRKRQMAEQIESEMSKMQDGASPDVVAARISELMMKSRVDDGGLRHIKGPLVELLDELEQDLKDPNRNKEIRTGIKDIDDCVEMRRKQLTIVAGRPSMGKSAFVGGVCRFSAKDKEPGLTCLFSLEMDAVSLVRRMLAADTRVATNRLHLHIGEEMMDRVNMMHMSGLYIDDRPRLTVSDIRAQLMRLGKIKLVAVDYLQLAKTNSKLESQNLRIGEISKGLKEIAKDFDCHVMALAQLNRSVENRTPPIPKLADLRDSGEIEQDADIVMLLYREHYYNEKADENDADVIIAKARNGRPCTVKIGWSPDRQQFYARART